jgi:hypothetical protein
MAAVKFNFEMAPAQIEAGIKSIGKRSKSLREDVHKVAVSVLVQWHKTGDVRQPIKFVNSLVKDGEAYYAQALHDWFIAFGEFKYEGGEFKPGKTKIDMDTVKAAKAQPFWDFSPPKAIKPLDLPAKIAALIRQAEKRVEDENKRADGDDVEKLKRQVEALKALHFETEQQ